MLTHVDHTFFRPKWRRVTATTFCMAWSLLEWVSHEPIWAVVAASISLYCLWHFFYTFDKNKNTSVD